MLSPHLHFGELSPRTVWHASRVEGDAADHHTYRRELIWRDFSAYLLWHNPTLPEVPLRPAFAKTRFSARTPSACAPGNAAAPACQSSTPACASSGRPAGCTTACA